MFANLIYIAVILGIQLIAFGVVFLIWRSDCKTHKKEDLAVSLEERLMILVIVLYIPMWLSFLMKISKELTAWTESLM